jgi:hypothetical protein
MPYPVVVAVEPVLTQRNRLTTLFRAILAIPHIILVGGVGATIASRSDGQTSAVGEGGLLGAVAFILAVVTWFTIVFAGTQLPIARQFTAFYVRWRVRALAYLMLLEDQYPPFGDGAYPASLTVAEPSAPRARLSVALRLIYAIPHAIALFFVMIGWACCTIAAWFIILVTGAYPKPLYDFAVGALRWRMRVDAYVLLMVDEYPPFSLD